MAKVTFQYRSKKELGKLSIRLTHGTTKNGIDIKTSTSLASNKSYWFNTAGKRRKRPLEDADSKNHTNLLNGIKEKIESDFIKDYNSGEIISVDWLKRKFEEHNPTKDTKEKRKTELDKIAHLKKMNLLTNAIETIFIKYQTNPRELKKYKVTLNLIKKYEKFRGTKFETKDVNNLFVDEFKNWCFEDMHFTKSYINSQLKRIRASINYAYANDEQDIIKISKQLNSFQFFKDPYKKKIVVTLNYEELDKIDKTEITEPSLLEAKKTILFGCETGLRYSDMNKLIDKNLKNVDGVLYWTFETSKTGRKVKIPISKRITELIEKYGLPNTNHPKNEVKLNRDIKAVCRLAGINEPTKGLKSVVIEINGKREKRNKVDIYPKYQLIATRTLRRSFATNYIGKLDIQLIMDITSHSTEKMLRAYIGIDDNSNILRSKNQIDQFHTERKEKKQNPKLAIIP